VVEDNGVNQKVARSLLEKAGHSVTIAENGMRALDLVGAERFDMIMMDIQMPEMDGYEATRRIRENEKRTGRHTPIVAMTAHALAGDRERCLAAGMDGYLAKPYDPPQLWEVLSRLGPARAARQGSQTDAIADPAGTSPGPPSGTRRD
jgi:CheY-like chemotaxis protein